MGEENNEQVQEQEETQEQEEQQDQEQSFTQSDVDSQISKAVDKALKNQQKKFEKEKEQAVADAKKDAADYAKMTKQQQQDADYEKRIKKLEERERELNMKQLTSEVESDLKENNLPVDFAQSLVALDDNEKIKESIGNIKKTFDEAVNAAVKEKLRQDTPKGSDGRVTPVKNPWKKGEINLTEQARVLKEDPEFAKKLQAQV